MKLRHIYTVIRPIMGSKLKTEIDDFGAYKDEAGEYLYGGSGGDEQIGVKLEYSEDGKTWKVADELKPK